MSHLAAYITSSNDARDQIDWNPEWSRRGRGVATYAALRQLGRQGLSRLVEQSCDHARELVTRIGVLEHAEVVWMPRINQGLVRFLDPNPDATDADHDAQTDAVIQAVLVSGEAFFSGTTWNGKRCMRVSVVNWQTSDADIERTVRAVQHGITACT